MAGDVDLPSPGGNHYSAFAALLHRLNACESDSTIDIPCVYCLFIHNKSAPMVDSFKMAHVQFINIGKLMML